MLHHPGAWAGSRARSGSRLRPTSSLGLGAVRPSPSGPLRLTNIAMPCPLAAHLGASPRWAVSPELSQKCRKTIGEGKKFRQVLVLLVRPAGFEPATLGLEGRCSIRLSYGRREPLRIRPTPPRGSSGGTACGRGRGIRTPDFLLPKQARYQAALYPVDRPLARTRTSQAGHDPVYSPRLTGRPGTAAQSYAPSHMASNYYVSLFQ